MDLIWHNILTIPVCEEWPGAAVPLWFRLSSDVPLQRVRRPRCLAGRGGRRVRTNVTSHLNARPASRGHGCGCPLPATEFVARRCPLVVDPMCRKPGSDDIDAVQRKHRNEQMAPTAQRYRIGHRIFDTLLKRRIYHRSGTSQFSGMISICFFWGEEGVIA